MPKPSVLIVGAGPGDPLLITVLGLRYLKMADVVVHDHLVHQRLLNMARSDAEIIDAGAAALQESLEQDAISFLLADKAREGKLVVRLKWGDPYVFDSGAKEAMFLHEQGIPFEVVPGIPAAIGVPCYSGVPVTYPEAGDALVLVRGHEDETSKAPNVDWKKLADLTHTIVCYAGANQLPHIIESLLTNGRAPTDRAAAVYNGTKPSQRTIEGTLEELNQAIQHSGEVGAAVLIVGSTVRLRPYLRWFDTRPLFGKRIIVTRAREQAGHLVDQLADLGAEPIEAASIQILPADDSRPLDEACTRLNEFDWIVFTSANGVEAFIQHLVTDSRDIRDLKGVRLCAVGTATADRLIKRGLTVDVIPEEHRAEAITGALQVKTNLTGARILLPRADIARDVLPTQLRSAGATVENVTAYRTLYTMPELPGDPDIYQLLLQEQIDAIIFTSASTVKNFVQYLGAESAADLLRTVPVASIGPVTAEAAQQFGIQTSIIPTKYTIPALVDALVEHFTQTGS